MKAAYWQRGEALDYKNTGTEKIEANTVIVLGSRIGVAGMEISPGETGTLHVTGVYSMQKGGEEIAAGADVYFSESDGDITTNSDGNNNAGDSCEAASAADTAVLVKINA